MSQFYVDPIISGIGYVPSVDPVLHLARYEDVSGISGRMVGNQSLSQ